MWVPPLKHIVRGYKTDLVDKTVLVLVKHEETKLEDFNRFKQSVSHHANDKLPEINLNEAHMRMSAIVGPKQNHVDC